MQTERSLPELTKDLAAQLSDLFRNEVRLARAETVESLKGLTSGLMRAAVGVVLAGSAVTLALFALAYALDSAMPSWAAALLAAIIGGGIAYTLIRSGMKAIAENKLTLPRTAEQVSRDLRTIKENVKP